VDAKPWLRLSQIPFGRFPTWPLVGNRPVLAGFAAAWLLEWALPEKLSGTADDA
jgi:hypothetical protein